MNLNLIFLGPPGSGKGTQTLRMAKKYGFFQLSTGDLVRNEIKAGTKMGLTIKDVVNAGGLPADEDINVLVRDCVKKHALSRGVIFDGYPRRVAQAEFLDQLLEKMGLKIDLVIRLVADDNVLMERIKGRFTCSSCGAMYNDAFNFPSQEGICDVCGGCAFVRRMDDSAEALKHRLFLYHKETEPIAGYYEAKGIVHSIDGTESIERVAEAVDFLVLNTRKNLKGNLVNLVDFE